MLTLAILGLTAVGGLASGAYITHSGLRDKDLKPTIFGVNAPVALGAAGLLAAFIGGPLTAAVGVGLALGSVISGYNIAQVKTGMDAVLRKQLTDGGAPSTAPAPPTVPKKAPEGAASSLFSRIFSHPVKE